MYQSNDKLMMMPVAIDNNAQVVVDDAQVDDDDAQLVPVAVPTIDPQLSHYLTRAPTTIWCFMVLHGKTGYWIGYYTEYWIGGILEGSQNTEAWLLSWSGIVGMNISMDVSNGVLDGWSGLEIWRHGWYNVTRTFTWGHVTQAIVIRIVC